MSNYHFDTYLPLLEKADIAVATRAGILRKYESSVVRQLQELTRMWLRLKLFYNLAPGTEERRIISAISSNAWISLQRMDDHSDFYAESLQSHSKPRGSLVHSKLWNKLIFLEEDHLHYKKNGKRIKILPPESIIGWSPDVNRIPILIEDTRLRSRIALMAGTVLEWWIDRIHIVSVHKKEGLKDELFTLEWVGTLIERNFAPEIGEAKQQDVNTLFALLASHKYDGQLKPRSKEYLEENWSRFLVARVDGIPVGCVEIIPVDTEILELWWIAVNMEFHDFRIGRKLVEAVEEYAYLQNKDIITITNNPKFGVMVESRWFERAESLFLERSQKSSGKRIYFKSIS